MPFFAVFRRFWPYLVTIDQIPAEVASRENGRYSVMPPGISAGLLLICRKAGRAGSRPSAMIYMRPSGFQILRQMQHIEKPLQPLREILTDARSSGRADAKKGPLRASAGPVHIRSKKIRYTFGTHFAFFGPLFG